MRLFSALSAAFVLSAVPAAALADDAFMSACRQAIKARLAAPSSYQAFRESRAADRAMTVEQYQRWRQDAEFAPLSDLPAGARPVLMIADFIYLADGVRGPAFLTAACDYASPAGAPPKSLDRVTIDGVSNAHWQAEHWRP